MFQDAKNVNISGQSHFVNKLIVNEPSNEPGGLENFKHLVSFEAIHDSPVQQFDHYVYPVIREKTRKRSQDWIDNPNATEKIIWLRGPPGIGTTEIALEIARREEVVTTFFFSGSDPRRSNGEYIFITLAWQLAHSIPDIKQHINRSIQDRPDLPKKRIEDQFDYLIVNPFRAMKGVTSAEQSSPLIAIIDRIDECADISLQRRILKVIVEAIRDGHVPLRFIISSRLDREIQTIFDQCPILCIDLEEFGPAEESRKREEELKEKECKLNDKEEENQKKEKQIERRVEEMRQEADGMKRRKEELEWRKEELEWREAETRLEDERHQLARLQEDEMRCQQEKRRQRQFEQYQHLLHLLPLLPLPLFFLFFVLTMEGHVHIRYQMKKRQEELKHRESHSYLKAKQDQSLLLFTLLLFLILSVYGYLGLLRLGTTTPVQALISSPLLRPPVISNLTVSDAPPLHPTPTPFLPLRPPPPPLRPPPPPLLPSSLPSPCPPPATFLLPQPPREYDLPTPPSGEYDLPVPPPRPSLLGPHSSSFSVHPLL